MKKKICLLLALTLCLLAAACTNAPAGESTDNSTYSTSGSATQTTAAAAQGRDSINLSITSDISSFDPSKWATGADARIFLQIYDPLLNVNADHVAEPRIAESFDVNEDCTVYTFKIRDDVRFHNGDMLKMSDIVFSFQRAVASPYLQLYVSGIDTIEDIGDNTIQIIMKAPNAPFFEYLSMILIVSERAVTEAGDDYDSNPVGTGPYQYVSYERANQIKLTRFDDYYRGAARIKDVTFRIISDLNTTTISLQAGDLDQASFATASYQNIDHDVNLKIEEATFSTVFYFIMNHEMAPFDNAMVRQAVNYAVDREFIIDSALDGFGVSAATILTPNALGYTEALSEGNLYDVEQAKALLAQAGITTPLDVGVIKTIESMKMEAQVLQQNLAAIGLMATVETMEATKYLEEVYTGNFTLGCMSITLTNDADSFAMTLEPMYINGNNMARYNNPVMTNLFAQARATADLATRVTLYAEIFGIAAEDAVYVPVYYPMTLTASDANLVVERPDMPYVYDMYWK